MKVRNDLVVSMKFCHDRDTSNSVSAVAIVDSAGYKYKSRWVANANYSASPPYYRQFPAGTQYGMWDRSAPDCQVTFHHDSLYAIGGLLTLECRGKLKPIPNIDNRFLVTSDTLKPNGDSVQIKRILIDRDPANSMFLDSLRYDIIKAIAWVEYAGSNDTIRHCHERNRQNLRYNDYWDIFITSHGDTCVDSLQPCENRLSTATGTMQMLRTVWASAFAKTNYIPSSYYRCIWDSLAWSWKINVFNGRYIYFKDNFYRIWKNPQQCTWDSVCTRCDAADSFPAYPNKEDLSVYGYKNGAPAMGSITADNWKNTVGADTDYVAPVRSAKHRRPWE
jgi:hypothetical protein